SFDGNTISNNSAASLGGGVFVKGAFSAGPFTPTFSGDTISNNTALRGGGIFADTADPVLTNATITANSATGGDPNGRGGGIWVGSTVSQTGSIQATGCTISDNT